MKILPLGINYSTRKLLVDPFDDTEFGAAIVKSFGGNAAQIGAVQKAARGAKRRGEAQREGRDEGDPRSVGWTVLLNKKDPDRKQLLDAIQPLAERRGMTGEPLYYEDEEPFEWYDWVSNNYSPLNDERPFYILILGGPKQVPFLFQ